MNDEAYETGSSIWLAAELECRNVYRADEFINAVQAFRDNPACMWIVKLLIRWEFEGLLLENEEDADVVDDALNSLLDQLCGVEGKEHVCYRILPKEQEIIDIINGDP